MKKILTLTMISLLVFSTITIPSLNAKAGCSGETTIIKNDCTVEPSDLCAIKSDNPVKPSDIRAYNVVKTKILEPGDDLIHGFIYYDGYLWASTRTSPCRILKIDPDTLNYERIILDSGLDYSGEDIIAANGYIWVILANANQSINYPSKLVRINPETLVWEIAVAFGSNELYYGDSLEYAFGYLWIGGNTRYGRPAIAQIDLNDLSYQIYVYPISTDYLLCHALTSGGGYIWASCLHWSSWESWWYADTIVRINPVNPTDYASIYINAPISDDIVYLDGYLYGGSEKSPSYIYI